LASLSLSSGHLKIKVAGTRLMVLLSLSHNLPLFPLPSSFAQVDCSFWFLLGGFSFYLVSHFCYFAALLHQLAWFQWTMFAPIPQVDCFYFYSFIVHSGTLVVVFFFLLPWLVVISSCSFFLHSFFSCSGQQKAWDNRRCLRQQEASRTTGGSQDNRRVWDNRICQWQQEVPGTAGGTQESRWHLGQQECLVQQKVPGTTKPSVLCVWIMLIYVLHKVARESFALVGCWLSFCFLL